MTGATMLVAALLLAAAALVAWPVQSVRARRRRVLATGRAGGVADPDDALVEWIRDLNRTPDGPVDGSGDLPTPGHSAGVAYQPSTGAGSIGSRTALGWPSRGATGSPSWLGVAGGSVGSTRPAGPTRPPIRRDPRRPAGTTRPEATTVEAAPRGATSVAAIDGGDVEVGCRGDTSGVATAETCGDVVFGDDRPVGASDLTVTRPSARSSQRVPWSTRRVLPLVGVLGGGVGAVVGGPVAAVAVGGYGALAVRAVLRWRLNRTAERSRRSGLDQLCGLAADLRAGLPVQHAIESAAVGRDGSDRLRQLTSAAVRLADRTGAPLAELVERIEADARATDRGLAAAAAQAAGARATAWLLAALPIGGIGLGYGIGVDPVAVLLHSTVGGACAVLAVALQVVGLLWAERLGATPGRAG
ncbi:type II secretion system F family protein [Micromonospora luteifusca]|uniref:type II secretion system F family protein n=1 Tax=Micromonospora luteifusca TaxID=709860 RepID=UPI0033B5D140